MESFLGKRLCGTSSPETRKTVKEYIDKGYKIDLSSDAPAVVNDAVVVRNSEHMVLIDYLGRAFNVERR